MPLQKSTVAMRGLLRWAAAFCVTIALATPAHAAFHLWFLSEVYTNASGTLQFIELTTTQNNQQFISGQSISVSNIGNSLTNTYNITLNSGSPTANHKLLFGTAGLTAAGGPTPDYIIPNGFLFSAGGSISYFGEGTGSYAPLSYSALPTDGYLSRTWGGGNALNSPTNFAGATSPVPEPATMILTPIAFASMYLVRRRRAAKSDSSDT